MMASFRYQAISLYKRILRVGKSWAAVSGTAADTQREKSYINTECRRLFELNRHVSQQKALSRSGVIRVFAYFGTVILLKDERFLEF